jgi:amidase
MGRDLTSRSAGDIALAVAERRLRAAEVAEAFLARVEAVNPRLNAVCTVNPSFRAEAEAIDRRLQQGHAARPLEGVPFVVKDVIVTKGLRTTFGSRLFEHHVPDQDAVSVERLRAAGAVLLGKTNTPEFAHDINTTNAVFGVTRNPWDVNATAGGSSGGTGAAVAAGMAPIGLGTDLGGSVRLPAAYCGIVGLRPSPGRVPIHPADFAWDTLTAHVHGPMAHDVADIGRMMAVLSGDDPRDPSSLPAPAHDYTAAGETIADLAGRRIAFSADLAGFIPIDPEVAALAHEAAHSFARIGCRIAETFPNVDEIRDVISGTRAFGMVGRYADYFETKRDLLSPPLVRQVGDSLRIDMRTVLKAERGRSRYWDRMRTFMADFDYVITATAGTPAFHLDRPLPAQLGGKKLASIYDTILSTYAFSLLGVPAMSVPCGRTADGRPVGLQIVGHRLREDRVLEAAAAYQRLHPDFFDLPEVSAEPPRPPIDLGMYGNPMLIADACS